jgi:hypothetical protein
LALQVVKVDRTRFDVSVNHIRQGSTLEGHMMILVPPNAKERDHWTIKLRSLRNRIQYHEREAARFREYLFPWELPEEPKRADARIRR